jgi:CheY-like chemotaxis protein
MDAAKHILVVEDNAPTRKAMKALLEAEGYRVGCAANGREGLDWLGRTELPSVILLDLNMPGMDGWQFRRHQQQDANLAGIPVVLLSSEHDLPRIAASLHAADYFPKPIELDDLLACVRSLTEGQSHARGVG